MNKKELIGIIRRAREVILYGMWDETLIKDMVRALEDGEKE